MSEQPINKKQSASAAGVFAVVAAAVAALLLFGVLANNRGASTSASNAPQRPKTILELTDESRRRGLIAAKKMPGVTMGAWMDNNTLRVAADASVKDREALARSLCEPVRGAGVEWTFDVEVIDADSFKREPMTTGPEAWADCGHI